MGEEGYFWNLMAIVEQRLLQRQLDKGGLLGYLGSSLSKMICILSRLKEQWVPHAQSHISTLLHVSTALYGFIAPLWKRTVFEEESKQALTSIHKAQTSLL